MSDETQPKLEEKTLSPKKFLSIKNFKDIGDSFDILTKGFLLIAASLFVVGYLIESIYLAKYGVLSFSIFRAQYILAGTVYLLTFLPAVSIMVIFIITSGKGLKDLPWGDKIRLPAQLWFANIVLFLLFFKVALNENKLSLLISNSSKTSFILVYPLLLVLLGFVSLPRLLREDYEKRSKITEVIFLAALCLIIVPSHITLVAEFLHPIVSPQFGGGKPTKVVLHFSAKDEDEEMVNSFLKTIQIESRMCKEPILYEQLLETDTQYIILSPCYVNTKKVHKISKDIVKWVEIIND